MRRIALIALTAGLAFSSIAAAEQQQAEEIEFHLNDVAGDANAINGQGFVTGGPDNQASGGQLAAADITGIRFVTITKGPLVTGLRVEFHLGAVPGPSAGNLIYRAVGTAGGCDLDVQFQGGVEGLIGSVRMKSESCGAELGATGTATIRDGVSVVELEEGTGIAVEILREAHPALDKTFKPGTVLTAFTAHSRSFLGASATGGVTVPQWDSVEDPTFTKYKIGE